MKVLSLMFVLLCLSSTASGATDNSCVSDCVNNGYKSYLCQARCSENESTPPAQLELQSQTTATDSNETSKIEPTPPKPIVTAKRNVNQKIYGFIDFGLVVLGNAPVDSTTGIRFGGGYQFNKYIGIESGFFIIKDVNRGDDCFAIFSTCPKESQSADSFQLNMVGSLPIDNKNEDYLLAEFGWANISLHYSYSYTPCSFFGCSTAVTGSGSVSKTNPVFGLGWERNTPPIKFRVRYENFGNLNMLATFSDGSTRTYDIKVEVISAGIVFTF